MALQKSAHLALHPHREAAASAVQARRLSAESTSSALLQEERERAAALRSFRSPRWLAGVALMVLSALLSLGVVALIGQSLSSSLAALTILYSLIISRLCLGETLPLPALGACALLVAGTVTVVAFGRPTSSGFLSPGDIEALLSRPLPIFFGAAVAVLLALLLAASHALEGRRSGCAWQQLRCSRSHVSRSLLLLQLALAGLLGATTSFASKGFASLAAFAVQTGQVRAVATGGPLLWLFLCGLLASVVLQASFLSAAMKQGALSAVVPAYQSSLVLGGAIFGSVFWAERQGATGAETVGFLCGIAVLLCGLALLGWARSREGAAAAAAAAQQLAPLAPLAQPHSEAAQAAAAAASAAAAAAALAAASAGSCTVSSAVPEKARRRSLSAPAALQEAQAEQSPEASPRELEVLMPAAAASGSAERLRVRRSKSRAQ
jgi:uncharacterized membrane protein